MFKVVNGRLVGPKTWDLNDGNLGPVLDSPRAVGVACVKLWFWVL